MDWLALYLAEDLGEAGDITTEALFSPTARGAARVVAREACVVAGAAVAVEVFERRGARAELRAADGGRVAAGTVVLDVSGPVHAILGAERTALNILARMSGVATATRDAMERLATACLPAVVAGTRKTTPGFRFYEKEAIRIGGGDPHRAGLFDAMMVKDNHIAAAGGLADAVRVLRAAHPEMSLEVEAESEADALAAAGAGVDWVMIDNQAPDVGRRWAQKVWDAAPGTKVEASGGITLATLLDYGWADRISLGALTCGVRCIDVGLDWAEGREAQSRGMESGRVEGGRAEGGAEGA